MDKIKFAVIGLGCRGFSMMKDVILSFDDVDVVSVCDSYEDRCIKAAEAVYEKRGYKPFYSTDYKKILSRNDIDAVYIATAWEAHTDIAVEAMEKGIAVALEVGGAYSIDECKRLVSAYERTKTPFMFLENCCYDKSELLVTSMVRAGKLGTVVHCSGAYAHDLRGEIAGGNVNRHYRLRNYLSRNCDNYPTHELGPIARLLNINRGNRMISLVSVASKSAGMEEYIKENSETFDKSLIGLKFKQGDIVTTVITCANGETITLTLDTTLPRSYNRAFTVHGTKGMYEQGCNVFFFDGMKEEFHPERFYQANINNAKEYEAEYLPSAWTNMSEETKKYGHGGMDSIEIREFIEALKNGGDMPIDVYDAASWMCITCLTEQSIKQNGMPQSIPDFTNGAWKTRPSKDVFDLSASRK